MAKNSITFLVHGRYALFTDPITHLGGDLRSAERNRQIDILEAYDSLAYQKGTGHESVQDADQRHEADRL